jgi:predicted ATPase/transcriptional regulator with XRE-family HTH domain
MKGGAPITFGAQLKALRETAGFTQAELATIAGLSVHAVSALERGERRRPQVETVRALIAALDLTGPTRDAFLGSARAVPPTAAGEELTRTFLPLPLTPLIGREADMQALGLLLTDPIARLITLIGPGGVGKTRLVLELARTVADEGSSRVRFVSLAPLRDPGFVAGAIAEALGLSDVTGHDLAKRARGACADQPTLLVLDNFEHLLDAAPVVVDLLASVLSLRLMVTSRAPLHVRGEREYVVGPLVVQGASETSPDDLAQVPAVRLFTERVQGVRPGFRLTSSNGPTVAAICRRLDALPLALELAAPWIKVLTLDELLRRLEHDRLLASIGARDLPARQQTMNATVAWSFQLLTPEEQRAFRRLSALPGRFPAEAAAAVLEGGASGAPRSADAVTAVAGLMDKSLILRTESSVASRPLYQMLETVRAYAALELASAGEGEDALAGLARYCAREASLVAAGLVGVSQREWLDRVRDDLESYRAALTWLIARGRAEEASNIAWAVKYFWLIRGHAAEGLQWYEQILALPSIAASAEIRALLGAAVMWYTQGELGRARTATARALTLADSAGDMEMVAQAEHLYGHVEHAAGNLNVAGARFAHSAEVFKALVIPAGTGNALSGMAVIALATGDTDSAERLLNEATSVLRHAGSWFLTWALYVRGILAVRRGHADAALTVSRESLTHIRELHDKFAFVYALVPLAAAAVLKGDDTWAARILGAREAVTERTGVTVVDRSVRDLRDQVEQEARARLGPDRWSRAYAAGRVASIDSLLKDIDAAVRTRANR